MKPVINVLLILFVTASCLTSDSALNASLAQGAKFQVQKSVKRLSMNSVACANNGLWLPSWAYRRWIPRQAMLQSKCLLP